MINWKNDDELFSIMKKYLYTAVIGDILDKMGYYHQFLPADIRPLNDNMIMAGRAMPVKEADINPDEKENIGRSFGLMLDALDDLKKNEIYFCTGASHDYALIGEIMCTRMKFLGAAGAVANGYHRDTKGILNLGFPAFSSGSYSQDQAPRGKVVDFRVPVKAGDVSVNPGDIMMGDIDGVVVIPQKIEKEVIKKAYEKATGEKTVGKAIENGMSAKDAFIKYGIM